MTERRGRTAAEWVTFAASCLVLAVVVGAIAVQLSEPRTPASPVATIKGPPRHVGDRYLVDVEVTNEGRATAAEVQVVAELEVGGTRTGGEQIIDFLAGDEHHDLVFIFRDDPAAGELTVEVSGFAEP